MKEENPKKFHILIDRNIVLLVHFRIHHPLWLKESGNNTVLFQVLRCYLRLSFLHVSMQHRRHKLGQFNSIIFNTPYFYYTCLIIILLLKSSLSKHSISLWWWWSGLWWRVDLKLGLSPEDGGGMFHRTFCTHLQSPRVATARKHKISLFVAITDTNVIYFPEDVGISSQHIQIITLGVVPKIYFISGYLCIGHGSGHYPATVSFGLYIHKRVNKAVCSRH